MVAFCTGDLALMRSVGVGHVLCGSLGKLLVSPTMTRQACHRCRRRRHSGDMALNAGDVRSNMLVDQKAMPAAWSGDL